MMGKVAEFFGVGAASGVVSAAEGIGSVIDRFVETDDEKRAADLLKTKIMMEPAKAQVELNRVEAGHRSVFVAGWRPFIGWVAGASLGIYFIPQFAMATVVWVMACYEVMETVTLTADNIKTALPPYPVNADGLMELVLAMLGLAGLRTIEKKMGRAK